MKGAITVIDAEVSGIRFRETNGGKARSGSSKAQRRLVRDDRVEVFEIRGRNGRTSVLSPQSSVLSPPLVH
jgi:hypothetical protein